MTNNKFNKILAAALFLTPLQVFAAFEYNLPKPVATITRDIFDLHMLTSYVAMIIMAIVTGIIVYSLYTHRKSKGYDADQKFHEGWFGRWSWVLVPVIVLGIDLSIATDATGTLNKVESYPKADLTVKVTGSQWKWTYEYMDGEAKGIKFTSNLKKLPTDHEFYLRDVDKPLVLPTGKTIRFLHTASDVLHAWWVPAIVYKKDSIPGYINETWTKITEEGTYRGQCAEMCGTGHAFMPIVVNVVSADKFDNWVAQQKEESAKAAAEASADKTWTKDELYQRGEVVYNTSCSACHQVNGEGLAGVFPGLKGSKIATEDMAAHINIVLNGKAGTAMAAWGAQLNDLEIAAVITYERNAWGNNTGDTVQPKDIKQSRK
jgi:cytochrome c oxidase subunit 2